MQDDGDVGGNANLASFDVAGAQRCLVSVLSFILYARGSLPEDCFRAVSNKQWADPKITHEGLISSGKPLSVSGQPREIILAQDGPCIYLRNAENHRLAGLLKALERVFAAVEQQRLGKIQICFTGSKLWDTSALIEFYSLKLHYTKMGSMHIYISWGGQSDTPIPTDCRHPLKEFLRTRPPIRGTYYTCPFLFSIDGKPLDDKQRSTFRDGVQTAVSILQGNADASGGRIGTVVYWSTADLFEEEKQKARQAAEADLAAQWRADFFREEYEIHDEDNISWGLNHRSLGRAEQSANFDDVPDWLSGYIPGPSHSPQRQLDAEVLQQKYDCNLSVIEETAEDLPPTQPWQSQTSLASSRSRLRASSVPSHESGTLDELPNDPDHQMPRPPKTRNSAPSSSLRPSSTAVLTRSTSNLEFSDPSQDSFVAARDATPTFCVPRTAFPTPKPHRRRDLAPVPAIRVSKRIRARDTRLN